MYKCLIIVTCVFINLFHIGVKNMMQNNYDSDAKLMILYLQWYDWNRVHT